MHAMQQGASEPEAFGTNLARKLGLPPEVFLYGIRLGEHDRLRPFARHLPPSLMHASIKRRHEFLAGRYCAAMALRNGGHGEALWLARGDDGLPCWPHGWIGSISHSTAAALAGVARSAGNVLLGIDVEQMVSLPDGQGMRELIGLPDELDMLAGLPGDFAWLLLFSAKESLFKALYPDVRQWVDFSGARLVAVQDGSLRLRLGEGWGARWPAGSELDIRYVNSEGHVITALYLS